jgi:hypothetical protein
MAAVNTEIAELKTELERIDDKMATYLRELGL